MDRDTLEERTARPASHYGRPARQARREQVARLTLKGLSCTEIARELGISHPTVVRDQAVCRAEWKESALRSTEEHVAQDARRLECLLSSVWDLAQVGDDAAVNTALKVLARKAKLLGLDKAANVDVTLLTSE